MFSIDTSSYLALEIEKSINDFFQIEALLVLQKCTVILAYI